MTGNGVTTCKQKAHYNSFKLNIKFHNIAIAI